MSAQMFMFQIGPVQAFIAASRRTQDLYVSSRILSRIALAGVHAAVAQGGVMLMPVADSRGKFSDSAPHLFACTYSGDTAAFGASVEAAMRQEWNDIAGRVRGWLERSAGSGSWTRRFDAQVARWLEVYWVAVEAGNSHGNTYAAARGAMTARKNLRHFPQMSDETGRKCTLTGAMAALDLDWPRLSKRVGEAVLRDNEALGAIAAIKRFAQDAGVFEAGIETFRDMDSIAGGSDDNPRYVAVLHMDGDKMGAHIRSLTTEQAHQAFTRQLSAFSDADVPAIIRKYPRAALVYAGGDDVLALLPVSDALRCANDIQTKFRQETGLTMSAGIAIAPSDYPFDLMLDAARKAEKQAKNAYGRDAVAVVEVHGGQLREAGLKWELLHPIHALLGYFVGATISTSIGYELRQIAHDLGGNVPVAARRDEAKRLFKQRTGEGANDSIKRDIQRLAEALSDLADGTGNKDDTNEHGIGWDAVANWAILMRFLSKQSGRAKQEVS